MTSRASNDSSARRADLRVTAVALTAALTLLAAPRDARACAADFEEIEALTTFDPAVLDEATPEGLFWDPYHAGFGGPCERCPSDEMTADWGQYLGKSVAPADWSKILLASTLPELDGLIFKLQKKKPKAPAGWESNSALKVSGDDAKKVLAALYFTGFARRVEPFAAGAPPSWDEAATKRHGDAVKASGDPKKLQENGEKALARAPDDFLRQRYAFQLLRLRFYRDDWAGVITWHDGQQKLLAGPSESLRWRARYYLAGALKRSGNLARANLEFAKIHAAFPALAGAAAQDFQPMEQVDWKACLALATDVREKTELWRLVGLKLDGQVAMAEIHALDPASDLLGLLVVRELAKHEGAPKELARLEALAAKLADAPRTNRPWLFDLVAAHAAALRGDLAATRTRLDRATKARPKDERVATQARATLALALAASWKPGSPALEQQLVEAVAGVDARFTRRDTVVRRVRSMLANLHLAAGRIHEAELFLPGLATTPKRDPWRDPAFVAALIERVAKPATPLVRFAVEGSGFTKPRLEQELALLHVVRGDFDAAKKVFETTTAESSLLGTDPFVMNVRDCHDCDHEKFGPTSKWTHESFTLRLAELKRESDGKGEAAAKAALLLGHGLYNLTWYGNARSFLESSHFATSNTSAAEAAYEKAFGLTADRELKATAAFMAAKCELARRIDASGAPTQTRELPIPEKWFPVVKSFADTKYHAEILKECGHYRQWVTPKG
ncbi:hypothetical protein L6R52_10955 [Myxococcota bacterium]|nr:hypothetical protein [Myxococcota bacterium]